MTLTPDREALLLDGDTAWQELCAKLDASPEGGLYGDAGEEWTARDVYAHFAHYHEATREALRKALAGDPKPWGTESEHVINARWKAADAALTLARCRRWAEVSREELRALLLSLTPEQWARYGNKWFTDDIDGGHYRGHLGYMEH
jgi:hypothetical protein